MLAVNEIFPTIQGEAVYTGTPSTFVRLQGCGVGCPWCDTKFTWAIDAADEASVEHVLAKTESATPQHARMTDDQLLAIVSDMLPRHVVFTGGEPALYDLTKVTRQLAEFGFSTQIETSGTQLIKVDQSTHVTLSPKIGMPGGFKVLDSAIFRADEIKMPVGKLDDIHKLDILLAKADEIDHPTIWLQPLSQSDKATKLCIDVATERGWKVSLQTHKYAGVR